MNTENFDISLFQLGEYEIRLFSFVIIVFLVIAELWLLIRILQGKEKGKYWIRMAGSIVLMLFIPFFILELIGLRILHFIRQPLFNFGEFSVSFYQIILILFLAGFIPVFMRLLKKSLSRYKKISSTWSVIIDSVISLIKLILWFFALIIVLESLGVEAGAALEYRILPWEKVTLTLSRILMIVFFVLITRIIILFIKDRFNSIINRDPQQKGKWKAIFQIISYLIWVVVIALILESIGLKVTILIASSAALLVGLGLGLQYIFNDIVSGVVLLIERSLSVDDVIEIEGVVGRVKEIGLRTSKIVRRDDIIMIIPNSKLTNDKVINWSHIETKTRFMVEVGVAYGSDVREVERILIECAKKHADIPEIPSPFVRFNNFGNSSLDFQLFFWTHKAFRVENIKSDLRFYIDEAFRENGVQIPFPQRDVHIKK